MEQRIELFDGWKLDNSAFKKAKEKSERLQKDGWMIHTMAVQEVTVDEGIGFEGAKVGSTYTRQLMVVYHRHDVQDLTHVPTAAEKKKEKKKKKKKTAPHDLCPCGSGRRYENCCGLDMR